MTGSLGPDAAGLLFVAPGNSPPTVGGINAIGDIYSVMTAVAPGIYYYSTD